MSDDGLFTFGYILNDNTYDPYTDPKSKSQEYIKNKFSSRLEKLLNLTIAARASGESDKYESLGSDLESNGTKTIVVPSDFDEIWARLQVLLRIELAGHTHTLIVASQLLDSSFKKGEIEREEQ